MGPNTELLYFKQVKGKLKVLYRPNSWSLNNVKVHVCVLSTFHLTIEFTVITWHWLSWVYEEAEDVQLSSSGEKRQQEAFYIILWIQQFYDRNEIYPAIMAAGMGNFAEDPNNLKHSFDSSR